jgi:hypothetical protein
MAREHIADPVKDDHRAAGRQRHLRHRLGKPGQLERSAQNPGQFAALVEHGMVKIERRLAGQPADLKIARRKFPGLNHPLKIAAVRETHGSIGGFCAAKQHSVGFDQPEIQVVGREFPEVGAVGLATRHRIPPAFRPEKATPAERSRSASGRDNSATRRFRRERPDSDIPRIAPTPAPPAKAILRRHSILLEAQLASSALIIAHSATITIGVNL